MRKIIILLFSILAFSEKKYIAEENMKKIRFYQENKTENKSNTNNKAEVKVEKKKKEDEYEIISIQHIDESEILKLNNMYNVEIKKVGDKYIFIGRAENIKKVKDIVYNIDRIKRQVIVKMNIIDTSLSLFDRLGFNVRIEENKGENLVSKFLDNKLSLTNLLNFGGSSLGIDLDSLKQSGDIYIKSFPSLIVLDNNIGEIKVTDELYFLGTEKSIQSSEAGLVFRIKPRIITKGYKEYVELEIYSEISSFKTEKVRSKNILNTKVLLKNKTNTFISNIGRESKSLEISSPGLPIFSTIFRKKNKNKEKRNIYVEVEVEILNE